MRRRGLNLLFCATLVIVSCGKENKKHSISEKSPAVQATKVVIEGNYQRVKKIDMADNSVTIYEKGSEFAKIGYSIKKVEDEKYVISFIEIDESGAIKPSSYPKTIELTKYKDVYQSTNSSGDIFSYYFENDGFKVSEFAKDKYGNIRHESDVYWKRLI